jgi:hypothetical protein
MPRKNADPARKKALARLRARVAAAKAGAKSRLRPAASMVSARRADVGMSGNGIPHPLLMASLVAGLEAQLLKDVLKEVETRDPEEDEHGD